MLTSGSPYARHMVRVSLIVVVLFLVSACGQTERENRAPVLVGGAGASGSAAGLGSHEPGGMGGLAGISGLAGVGGLATTGGLAGIAGLTGMGGLSQVQSAIIECEQYCETSPYRLPAALCEDWNHPGWDPPFCQVGGATPCAEYCSSVYEALTSECAALLPAVIRCVAPTYAEEVVVPTADCWLRDCRAQLFSMTSACYGLREKLAEARAVWQKSEVVDYQLSYDGGDAGRARVVVRGGSEAVVTPRDAIPWTVPELFDEVERYLQEPGVAPQVTYDADLGYVVALVRQEGCTESSVRVSGTEVAPLR